MKIALGLLHYPILDRQKKVVATNVTNLDVHDIARACRVYGVERYYIIHPMEEQLMFVSRMLEHWRIGDGARFNPMRKTALTMVHTASSLEKAVADWSLAPVPEIGLNSEGDSNAESNTSQIPAHKAKNPNSSANFVQADNSVHKVEVISTHARKLEGVPQLSFRGLRERIKDNENGRIFLLFGTGFGLTEEVMKSCDGLLEPIRGASTDDYRHLSVRSAVSICLDRLLGPW